MLLFEKVKKLIENLFESEEISHVDIVKQLKAIVPEYVSNNSIFESLDKEKVKVKQLKIG